MAALALQDSIVEKEYRAEDIEVLKGLEPIRRRPAMYLDGDPKSPIIQNELIKQSLCHAIDEHLEGNCKQIDIKVFSEQISISYDAAMSLKVYPDTGVCAAEVMMTTLYACHNLKKNIEVGGKFCRIGITVVNALSSKLELEVLENGTFGKQTYCKGEPVSPFQFSKSEGTNFTKIMITPDNNVFGNLSLDRESLFNWANEVRSELPNLILNISLEA